MKILKGMWASLLVMAGAADELPGPSADGEKTLVPLEEDVAALSGVQDRKLLQVENARIERIRTAVIASLPKGSTSSGDWEKILQSTNGADLLAQGAIRRVVGAKGSDPEKLVAFFDKVASSEKDETLGLQSRQWVSRKAMLTNTATSFVYIKYGRYLSPDEHRKIANDPIAWKRTLEPSSVAEGARTAPDPDPGGQRTPDTEVPDLVGDDAASGQGSGESPGERRESPPPRDNLLVVIGLGSVVGIFLILLFAHSAASRRKASPR